MLVVKQAEIGVIMPNWCYTNMEVRGDEEDLDAFVAQLEFNQVGPEGIMFDKSLNDLFPVPAALVVRSGFFGNNEDGTPSAKQLEMDAIYAENRAKLGHQDWYSWSVENYGTKWGACRPEFDRVSETVMTVNFESAWNPADGLIRHISKIFPELLFACSYTEESEAFVGWEVFLNGSGGQGFATDEQLASIMNLHPDGAEWTPEISEAMCEMRSDIEMGLADDMEKFIVEFTDKL